jgi:hypothetical protein
MFCATCQKPAFLEPLANKIICEVCDSSTPNKVRESSASLQLPAPLSPRVGYPFSPADEINFQYPPFLLRNDPLSQREPPRSYSSSSEGTTTPSFRSRSSSSNSNGSSVSYATTDTIDIDTPPSPLESRRNSRSSWTPPPPTLSPGSEDTHLIASSACPSPLFPIPFSPYSRRNSTHLSSASASPENSPFCIRSVCSSPPPEVPFSPMAKTLFPPTVPTSPMAGMVLQEAPSLLFYTAIRAHNAQLQFLEGTHSTAPRANLLLHLQNIYKTIEDTEKEIQLHQKQSDLIKSFNLLEEEEETILPLNLVEKELIHPLNPIRLAISSGHTDASLFLLSLKRNIINLPIDNETPLLIASAHQQWEIVEHLLTRPDCEVDHVNTEGNNALMIACKHRKTPFALIRELIRRTKNIHQHNRKGDTALIKAYCYNAPTTVIQLLLSARAKCTTYNNVGYTALMGVCKYRSENRQLMQNAQNNLLLLLEVLSASKIELRTYLNRTYQGRNAFQISEKYENIHYLSILDAYGAHIPNNTIYDPDLSSLPELIRASSHPCAVIHVCTHHINQGNKTNQIFCSRCGSIYAYNSQHPPRLIFPAG